MSHRIQVTFNARDPRALSSFWRDALGCVQVPEGKVAKNCVHLEGNEFCLD